MATKSTIPHSWPLSDWPAEVYPNDPGKARYLARAQRDALVREGAMVRIGRELVFIGDRYARFLAKGASKVAEFECPANRHREAAA
jgi:hypothetical protein